MNATRHNYLVLALRRLSLSTSAAALAFMLAPVSNAASFDFAGSLHAANSTANPWVGGSTMWGTIETGDGTGTSQSGFAYLASRDVSLLTFTFGDLELTSSLSPGIGSLGFERYTENDASVMPFTISYNGIPIATGTSDYLYDEVSHSLDFTAVGDGQVTLTAPGGDPTFYNEVTALTGGSRVLQVTLASFDPVDNLGNFTTTGTISAVPEPREYAALSAAGLIGWAAWRRSRRTARA
jgi:hypothetical protein